MTSAGDRYLVAIGGGGGVSQLLQGVEPYFARRTAVIAVTDTGRSTGVARAIGDIPAPGDLRNTLASMAAEPDGLLARLIQHRLVAPTVPVLDGMAFGNLLIAALTQLGGDFGNAVATVSRMLDCQAEVLPVSNESTQLCATLADGRTVERELEVRGLNKPPIQQLFLNPPAAATPAVMRAIAQADLIALGPGSFFTSLMATLCFEGLVDALRQTRATIVFICNSTTQPGQTDGMGVYDHVQRLVERLGSGVVDHALISRGDQIDPAVRFAYATAGLQLLEPDDDELDRVRQLGVQPLVRELLEVGSGPRELWNKLDTIRSDPELLGLALWKIMLDQGNRR